MLNGKAPLQVEVEAGWILPHRHLTGWHNPPMPISVRRARTICDERQAPPSALVSKRAGAGPGAEISLVSADEGQAAFAVSRPLSRRQA